MKSITAALRDNILAQLQAGKSARAVSQSLHVPKSTVGDIRKSLGRNLKPAKTGRPAKLSPAEKRYCVHSVTTGQQKSAVQVARSLIHDFNVVASAQTVRRVLHDAGLGAIEKESKPALSRVNIKKRLDFAKRHRDWTVTDWRRVIWSDESKVNRFNSDGRAWAWVRDGESLQDRHVKPTVKHGGGSIMVWGCMTYQGPGFLCKIDNTLDSELYKQILDGELKDSIDWYKLDPKNVIFQHDNDPKQKSKLVSEYLGQQPYRVLQWPPQSPDLNPIEHAWALVKRRLNDFDTPPSGMLELWERIEHVWNHMTPADCQSLIDSMPRRIEALLKAKGRWTEY